MSAEDKMPMELQLDLLVDGELAEVPRKELLLKMNRAPAGPWRDLAVRFLQRQMEKQTARELMAGGAIVPVERVPEIMPERAVVAGRVGWSMNVLIATAAGLLIATVSAMVTFYALRSSAPGARPDTVVAAEFQANLPKEAVSFDRSVPVTVPVVSMPGSPALFTPEEDDPRMAKRSWVIQPDGKGKAVLIPVNTLKAAVY